VVPGLNWGRRGFPWRIDLRDCWVVSSKRRVCVGVSIGPTGPITENALACDICHHTAGDDLPLIVELLIPECIEERLVLEDGTAEAERVLMVVLPIRRVGLHAPVAGSICRLLVHVLAFRAVFFTFHTAAPVNLLVPERVVMIT
jgi:hypothetical protein